MPSPPPSSVVQTYEALRAEVMAGQSRPEGLGALIYHGMVRGLAVILTGVSPPKRAVDRFACVTRATSARCEFVRVLANMLLQTQSEALHVY